MEEFFYDDTKYIKRKDLVDFEELMMKYGYMPEDIEDDDEFNIGATS